MYRQTLMAGLRAAAKRPANLAKVNQVRQEPNESPAAILERLMEAFRQYTPMDPQADESRAAVLLAFVNQAAPDIRRKLQKIERLGEQTIQDLVRAAEKVFNNRGTPEKREERIRQEGKKIKKRSDGNKGNIELRRTGGIKKNWFKSFLWGRERGPIPRELETPGQEEGRSQLDRP